MHFVSDLHLHSKYSRAVSQQMILPIMAEWGRKKGLDILATGDWTHPLWLREIRSQLQEDGEGLYKLKSEIRNPKFETNSNAQNSPPKADQPLAENVQKDPLFLLSTEIASIYKQGEKVRRIHNLVFAPNFETVEKINKELVRRGCNLMADGRPIVGLSSKDLLELVLSIDDRSMLIPCHVWTPHFGIYGSASGFDSLDEAFGEFSKYIYGIETGLSSDPEMNWQMKELKNRSILSFSDAHSPAKMAREATVFELEKPSYENIRKAIMRKTDNRIQKTDGRKTEETDKTENQSSVESVQSAIRPQSSVVSPSRILYTIEFYPEEGKYHFSGHRNCKVVRGPEETKKEGNICPVCKRTLTEGVLYRVSQLGDKSLAGNFDNKMNSNNIKWYTDKAKNHPPYVKLVPLLEIVAQGLSRGARSGFARESTVASQKVRAMFDGLCEEFSSEIEVLLKTPIDLIENRVGKKIAEGIEKVRKGTIVIDPGYDGEYGKVKIWNHDGSRIENKQEDEKMQMGLGF